jgi:DNA polymerase
MELFTLDFESFYSRTFSLSKLTYDEYINDDQFEVIGVGVKRNSEPTQWFSGTKQETHDWLAQFDLDNNAVIMHNAMFDASILAFHFGIYPKVILDTLAMARALHGATVGNSLKRLAEYYGVGEKGTEVHNFIDYRRDTFTPQELAAYGEYCKQDVNLTKQIFDLMRSKFNQTELKLIDMTIRMYTEPKFMYDREFLVQHLKEVQDKREGIINDIARRLDFIEVGISNPDEVVLDVLGPVTPERRDKALKVLRSNPKFAELLRSYGVEPPMKTSPATGKDTYALAKTDEGMKALLEHENPDVQALAAARLGVKSSLEETRTQRLIDTGDRNNGYLPIGLNYYAARSGRWGGTQQSNWQNIPRDSGIKLAIVPPPGYVVIGADLSNIELRVGLWLAGQWDKLQLLQEGKDLYKDFASSVFNVPYDEVNKDQRFIAKTAVLSLLFGSGHVKLREAIKASSGVDIGAIEAKRIVDAYRQDYAEVTQLWKVGGEALVAMQNDYAMDFGYNNLCAVEGGTGIRLPSGLHLQFPNLRQQYNDKQKLEWVYDKSSKEVDRMYGGKCMQNVTQSVARCVIGEAMVRINKKYPLALTIHDAVYLTVREQYADEALKFVEDEMVRAPSWLPGIVLGVEGHIGRNLKEV